MASYIMTSRNLVLMRNIEPSGLINIEPSYIYILFSINSPDQGKDLYQLPNDIAPGISNFSIMSRSLSFGSVLQ
jgi:hypothetical protein